MPIWLFVFVNSQHMLTMTQDLEIMSATQSYTPVKPVQCNQVRQ